MSVRRNYYLKLAATVVLLIVLIVRVDLSSVLRTMADFGPGIWVVNLILYAVALGVAAIKWKVLLPSYSFRALLSLNMVGQYYSILLPGQIAGEIVKAYRLGRGKQDAEKIAASVIIDRITGFLGLLVVALAGALFSRSEVDRWVGWVLFAAILLLLAGLFCLKIPWWFHRVRGVASCLGRFGETLGRVVDAWKIYLERPGRLVLSILVGAGFQLIAVFINLVFARNAGVLLGFADWCWVFGLISVVTMLPFTVAGLGLREGSFVGALALFGVSAEKALALSLAIFALQLAGAIVGGVIEWTRVDRSPA